MHRNIGHPVVAAPVSFESAERVLRLAFQLHDQYGVEKGADLLSEVMSYVRRERLALPVEFVAALCMTVAGEFAADEQLQAA